MFPETYTKFFSFMALAVLCGFISMEIVTSGIGQDRPTGFATGHVTQAGPGLAASAGPGANLLFLFVGIFAGITLLGAIVYIYSIERKQI